MKHLLLKLLRLLFQDDLSIDVNDLLIMVTVPHVLCS